MWLALRVTWPLAQQPACLTHLLSLVTLGLPSHPAAAVDKGKTRGNRRRPAQRAVGSGDGSAWGVCLPLIPPDGADKHPAG